MDLRIDYIFRKEMKGDTSFQEEENPLGFLFGSNKYTRAEVKEIWDSGIKHGIEIGLRHSEPDGVRIQLKDNTIHPKHREFLEKFHKLADEYNCCISYHPLKGMIVKALKDH